MRTVATDREAMRTGRQGMEAHSGGNRQGRKLRAWRRAGMDRGGHRVLPGFRLSAPVRFSACRPPRLRRVPSRFPLVGSGPLLGLPSPVAPDPAETGRQVCRPVPPGAACAVWPPVLPFPPARLPGALPGYGACAVWPPVLPFPPARLPGAPPMAVASMPALPPCPQIAPLPIAATRASMPCLPAALLPRLNRARLLPACPADPADPTARGHTSRLAACCTCQPHLPAAPASRTRRQQYLPAPAPRYLFPSRLASRLAASLTANMPSLAASRNGSRPAAPANCARQLCPPPNAASSACAPQPPRSRFAPRAVRNGQIVLGTARMSRLRPPGAALWS